MRHKSFLIRLISFCLCLASASAQTKSAVEFKRQTEKVDAFVRETMAVNHIPGLSLAVLREGKIILAKGYGVSNLELATPVTEKTAFVIFSLTKTFTGVATMMLVEEGKISLADPIAKHLAGLPAAWQNVTIRHLLSHTSGLPDYKNSFTKIEQVLKDYSHSEVLQLVANNPLVFPTGERWLYTDTNFYLLGMLIEKVSGKTYEQFLRERIFTPLGMSDTRIDSHRELIPNRADGYTWSDGAFRNALRYSPTLTFSTAGLVSTVLDLAKWDASLYTEGLVKRSTLEQMWTNARLNNGEIVPDYGLAFGLSPYKGHRRVGHTGGADGFVAAISRFVDDKVTVIVLTNADQKRSFFINGIANEIASYYFSR